MNLSVTFEQFQRNRWVEENAVALMILAAAPQGDARPVTPTEPGDFFGEYFGEYFGDFFDGSV
jgi:hypothetical protein